MGYNIDLNFSVYSVFCVLILWSLFSGMASLPGPLFRRSVCLILKLRLWGTLRIEFLTNIQGDKQITKARK